MQAVILAGGLGTRLGEITRDIPKPMVPVGDKPFLQWLIELMKRHDIRRFVLCVGYKAERIREYFGDGSDFDCHIDYSIEEELLGTGGAIKQAASFLDETFFVVSGDNYLPVNFKILQMTFPLKPAIGMLACWDNKPELFRKNVLLDVKTSQVLEYDFDSAEGKNYVDSGVKIFSKKLLDYFPEGNKFSLERDVMTRLSKAGHLYGFPVNFPPLDVGTPEGLAHVRKELLKTHAKIINPLTGTFPY